MPYRFRRGRQLANVPKNLETHCHHSGRAPLWRESRNPVPEPLCFANIKANRYMLKDRIAPEPFRIAPLDAPQRVKFHRPSFKVSARVLPYKKEHVPWRRGPDTLI